MHERRTNAELLTAWRDGDERAADVLFQRYVVRLTALARARLSRRLARRVDPEDIVLSAYRSFFIGAREGRFQPGADDDLWPLLVTLVLRKTTKQVRHYATDRRQMTKEESGLEQALNEKIANDPSPEDAALVADEVQHLMSGLDGRAREVVVRQLQGDDTAQIARELGCSERTIRRIAERVRTQLSFEVVRPAIEQDASAIRRFREDGGASPARRAASCSTGPVQPTHSINDVVLHELIGQGTFSKVFRATDRTSAQTVAVKFLRKSLWQDARAADGIKREYAALSGIRHPNILRANGWGLAPSGAMFLVSEWIDGESLAEWRIVNHPAIADIARTLLVVAKALGAAHASGVLHGDLKPQNILRERSGRIVLTDFGMARWFQRVDDEPPRGGSAGFLSPEQVSAAFGDVTEQTDVYAWGGLAYALLTGLPPIQGRDLPETIANRAVVGSAGESVRTQSACAHGIGDAGFEMSVEEPVGAAGQCCGGCPRAGTVAQAATSDVKLSNRARQGVCGCMPLSRSIRLC